MAYIIIVFPFQQKNTSSHSSLVITNHSISLKIVTASASYWYY